ncbi:MAG: sigma-70 family RNA polymerase sigma factor [Thermoanaerobaculia bacterium]|nr:sigma-70 family RNA polymerase sigma factor [Thermoanaerobaculia bacterium]
MQTPAPHNDDILAELRSGRMQALEDLYARYRADFFRWAGRRFDANRQDFEDAWQESVLALYTQVISGKLTALRFGVRVWLFAVGYRILLKNKRKTKRILWKDNIDEALRHDASWLEYQENQTGVEKKESLHSAMKTMSDQCREMLVQRYFLEKSIEEMQREWEHNNTNTTSATLSRCLRKLKDLIKTARAAAIR